MKDRTIKRLSRMSKLLAALVVAFALIAAPFAARPAYAKSLRASGVKSTAVGRVNKTKMWYAGAGKQNCTCSIKSIKVKNAKKAGYKTATVVFEVKEPFEPNNRQVMSMADYEGDDGWRWAFIVDGKTGENLEAKAVAARHHVTLKTSGWWYSNTWRYTATDGSWVEISKTNRIKYTITYPKSYRNLYVGIGSGQRRYNDSAMRKFENGRVTYDRCWWHKYNKSSTFFVKVR